jgi:hypothetical protein
MHCSRLAHKWRQLAIAGNPDDQSMHSSIQLNQFTNQSPNQSNLTTLKAVIRQGRHPSRPSIRQSVNPSIRQQTSEWKNLQLMCIAESVISASPPIRHALSIWEHLAF